MGTFKGLELNILEGLKIQERVTRIQEEISGSHKDINVLGMITILHNGSFIVNPGVHQNIVGHKRRYATLEYASVTTNNVLGQYFRLESLIDHYKKHTEGAIIGEKHFGNFAQNNN